MMSRKVNITVYCIYEETFTSKIYKPNAYGILININLCSCLSLEVINNSQYIGDSSGMHHDGYVYIYMTRDTKLVNANASLI